MARRTLRAVAADESASPPARTFTVSSASSEGTRRDVLVAMRARIATAVDDPNTPARDLAALTKRLIEVVKEIDAMDAADQEAQADGPVEDEAFDASAV